MSYRPGLSVAVKSLLAYYLTYGVGRNPEVCVIRKEASGSRDLSKGEP